MSEITSKEQLFAARPLRTGFAEFQGQQIPVRELTAEERDKINVLFRDEQANVWKVNAHMAAYGCTLLSEEDIPQLMSGTSELIEAIIDKVSELSGMDEEAHDAAKKS